jgi:hypothetical protein
LAFTASPHRSSVHQQLTTSQPPNSSLSCCGGELLEGWRAGTTFPSS